MYLTIMRDEGNEKYVETNARVLVPPRLVSSIYVNSNGVASVYMENDDSYYTVKDDEALYALALRVYNDLRVTGEIG